MYDQMKIEDDLYQIRPMNCPYHILMYKRKLNSYREFPIRVAELGTVYRYELSGSLHGLFRVRGFTQVWSNTSFQFTCIPIFPIFYCEVNSHSPSMVDGFYGVSSYMSLLISFTRHFSARSFIQSLDVYGI